MVAAIGFVSCKKELVYKAVPTSYDRNTTAFLKVNYNSAYAKNPGVQLKLNGTRVSSLLTARTPFPGGGYNTNGSNYPNYLPVTPGSVKFQLSLPYTNTDQDSVVLFTQSLTLDAGKFYTAHVTDTAANTKLFLTTDDMTLPDTAYARFRFVNLMPDVPAIDLYYGSTIVASNIAYLSASNYFTVHTVTTPNPLQTWAIRPAGAAATTTALATYNSSNTVLNQRNYTAFAVGYKLGVDAVRKPYISFLLTQ